MAAWLLTEGDAGKTAGEIAPTLDPYFGGFDFHFVRRLMWPPPFRQMREFGFYILRGLSLARRNRYDAVVAYGPFLTALAGWLIARATGTPFVVEVPGNHQKSHSKQQRGQSFIRSWLAPAIANFLLRRADHLKLLYPEQVPDGVKTGGVSVFHNFVPVHGIERGEDSERLPYMMLVGGPLYLKGADLLIEVFKRVEDEYPDWRLKILGYSPDYEPFRAAAGGHSRIEILGPRPHQETLQLLRGASLLVHPSRTEAMGRVLLEAMACGTPILASNVDGIPHYVKDGVTGLLFETENVESLERQLRYALENPDRIRELSESAHSHVLKHLDESNYVRSFCTMLQGLAWRSNR